MPTLCKKTKPQRVGHPERYYGLRVIHPPASFEKPNPKGYATQLKSLPHPPKGLPPAQSLVLLLIQTPQVVSPLPYQLRLIGECGFHIGLGFNLRYCKEAIERGSSGDLPLVFSKGSF